MLLYHATYRELLPSIKLNGLGAVSTNPDWCDYQGKNLVYLATDYNIAESYAEVGLEVKNLPDWDIIIFEVDIKNLNKNKLLKDPNIENSPDTFQYNGIIEYKLLKEVVKC